MLTKLRTRWTRWRQSRAVARRDARLAQLHRQPEWMSRRWLHEYRQGERDAQR